MLALLGSGLLIFSSVLWAVMDSAQLESRVAELEKTVTPSKITLESPDGEKRAMIHADDAGVGLWLEDKNAERMSLYVRETRSGIVIHPRGRRGEIANGMTWENNIP